MHQVTARIGRFLRECMGPLLACLDWALLRRGIAARLLEIMELPQEGPKKDQLYQLADHLVQILWVYLDPHLLELSSAKHRWCFPVGA